MQKPLSTFMRLYQRNTVFISLIFLSAVCLFILILRMKYTHSATYSFMARNLLLAWIPLISAFFAHKLRRWNLPGMLQVLPIGCVAVWFVFLPNAPYLITDVGHFSPRGDIFVWFDLTLFVAFAMTGLLYGLVSLYWMQQIVASAAGIVISWAFVLNVLAFTSFGIYLGRFLRWNSWDLIRHPISLLADILDNVQHPMAHFQTYAFSGLFTLFLIASYFTMSTLTYLSRER